MIQVSDRKLPFAHLSNNTRSDVDRMILTVE